MVLRDVSQGIFIAACRAQTLSYSITNTTSSLEVGINIIAFVGLVLSGFGSFLAYVGNQMASTSALRVELLLDEIKTRQDEQMEDLVDEVLHWRIRLDRSGIFDKLPSTLISRLGF